MRNLRSVALLLCAFLLASCGGLSEAMVRADRATYEALAPDLRALYSGQVPQLDEQQRQLRLLTVDTWQQRLVQEEALLGAAAAPAAGGGK